MTTAPPKLRVDDRVPGTRRDREILARLRKAHGQLAGIATMHEQRRYCIDILDQLAAVNAAVDAVALMLLEDHVNNCVRAAADEGDVDERLAEVNAAIRRYVKNT